MLKLLAEYKYKIELHAHTHPTSKCSSVGPAQMVSLMKEHGYDGVVITNHFLVGNAGYYNTDDPVTAFVENFNEAKAEGEKQGIKVYFGAEYRFPENMSDYLVFGANEKFLRDTFWHTDLGLEKFYKEFHNDDMLILQAHPFREGDEVADISFLDGLEIMNMSPDNKNRAGMSAKFARDNNISVVTVGTDLHHADRGHAGICALRTKILPADEKELVEILKSGDYIFEIGGYPMLPNVKL